MRGFFSVRNSLLLIGGVGTLLLAGLTVVFWFNAQADRDDSKRIIEHAAIEDQLLLGAYSLALERSLAHAALNFPDPTRPSKRFASPAARVGGKSRKRGL